MAGLEEIEKWESEIYQIEENDPVQGGANGITNKPTKQLANRTLYLRKLLIAAGQKAKPLTITATSQNVSDENGHTHAIDHASTSRKGVVQLTNDTGLDSESLALTAKAGKKLAQSIAQNQLKTTEAKSRADSAYNLANGKQSPATTLSGYGITDYVVKRLSTENLNDVTTVGVYGQSADTNALANRNYPEQQAGTLFVTTSAYGVQQEYTTYHNNHKYVRGRTESGWRGWERIDGIDKVNRSGDEMTGNLTIKNDEPRIHGKKGNDWGWYVGFPGSNSQDVLWHNYLYNTNVRLKSDRVESNKDIYVGSYLVITSNILASLTQRGIVQLTSDTGLDSESLALSAKGAKKLSQQIAQNQLKTNEVKNATDNAQRRADSAYNLANGKQSPATTLAGYGITDFKVQFLSTENLNDVMTVGVYGQPADTYALTNRNYPEQQAGTLLVTKSAYSVQQEYTTYHNNHKYVRGRTESGWRDWERIDGIDKVNRSGDTMTGHLTIQNGEPRVHGKRGNEMGWYVGFPNTNDRDVLWHSYLYNTNVRLKLDRVESNKEIYVGTEKVHHTGDSYARLSARDSGYAGIDIVRSGSAGSWSSRFEALPNKQWKFWVQGSHEILLPAKGGTVLLDNDFSYQKIGNFEVYRYPDGSMTQIYSFTINDLVDWSRREFNWAVAFKGTPHVFTKITTSVTGSHDCGVNVLTSSNNAKVYYHFYENGNVNQGQCRVQFLAMGRWK